jgi:hypothetical protein
MTDQSQPPEPEQRQEASARQITSLLDGIEQSIRSLSSPLDPMETATRLMVASGYGLSYVAALRDLLQQPTSEPDRVLREALDSIIVRCTNGAPDYDWRPVIRDIAQRAINNNAATGASEEAQRDDEPRCADPACGCPRYAHRCDLRTGRYGDCLRCRRCSGYQSAVLNAAIANLRATPPAPSAAGSWATPHVIHEDELPAGLSKDDYDTWYALSWIHDGVRVGPRPPNATLPAAEEPQDELDIYDAVAEFRERTIDSLIAADPALQKAFDIQQPKSYQPSTTTTNASEAAHEIWEAANRDKGQVPLPDEMTAIISKHVPDAGEKVERLQREIARAIEPLRCWFGERLPNAPIGVLTTTVLTELSDARANAIRDALDKVCEIKTVWTTTGRADSMVAADIIVAALQSLLEQKEGEDG